MLSNWLTKTQVFVISLGEKNLLNLALSITLSIKQEATARNLRNGTLAMQLSCQVPMKFGSPSKIT